MANFTLSAARRKNLRNLEIFEIIRFGCLDLALSLSSDFVGSLAARLNEYATRGG